MSNLNPSPHNIWICSKCEKVSDPISVDMGNYEEAWGARVWRPEHENVSDCCQKEIHTLHDWLSYGWEFPSTAADIFTTEELAEIVDDYELDLERLPEVNRASVGDLL